MIAKQKNGGKPAKVKTDGEAIIHEPEPWDEPVGGSDLASELAELLQRYVVMASDAVVTVVLWMIGTYLFKEFLMFPRLAITSPEKRCGKTTLLDILNELVCRPLLTANTSPAAVFRLLQIKKATLLIDEADRAVKGNDQLISILNAGHRKGGLVIRAEKIGNTYVPRTFDVYSPAATAGIGSLPDTLADRSVHARLRRALADERVESLRLDKMENFRILARKCARWAADNRARVRAHDPEMPSELYNRVADNWRPLLAIADVIDGDWPTRARQVATSAARDAADASESDGTMLLEDLRGLFNETMHPALFTSEILNRLCDMEHRPWPEWRDGKPLTATGLAKLLKPFGVSPRTVRRGDATGKGYNRADLEDAFARYLK